MLAGRKAVRFNNKSFLGDQGKRKKLSFCLLKLKKLEKEKLQEVLLLREPLSGSSHWSRGPTGPQGRSRARSRSPPRGQSLHSRSCQGQQPRPRSLKRAQCGCRGQPELQRRLRPESPRPHRQMEERQSGWPWMVSWPPSSWRTSCRIPCRCSLQGPWAAS